MPSTPNQLVAHSSFHRSAVFFRLGDKEVLFSVQGLQTFSELLFSMQDSGANKAHEWFQHKEFGAPKNPPNEILSIFGLFLYFDGEGGT